VPFRSCHLDEVPATAGMTARLYDVELPYRRLGRCRLSAPDAAEIGVTLERVAVALSNYEARVGRAKTASQLLGVGVDLGLADAG
jgi:hypothetical protein